jgi:predicted chitinase
VRRLQKRLTALGFDTGGIDGVFGHQTDTAVRAFQKSKGLEVDGVAGPNTLAALAMKRRLEQHHANGTLTPAKIAAVLGCSVQNVRANWPPILQALEAHGIDSVPCQIAVLATVGTEVGSFEPINEFGDHAYFTRMYEGRHDLGNVHSGDGARYHGRGYIQVTGRANYHTYGKKLGVPLEDQPELALRPDVAAKVLAAYVADHRIAELAAAGDWQGVRRAVNGGLNGWDRFSSLVQGLEGALKTSV